MDDVQPEATSTAETPAAGTPAPATETPKQDAPKHETPAHEAPKRESQKPQGQPPRRDDRPRDDRPREDRPREDRPPRQPPASRRYVGCRISEALALTPHHVDAEPFTLTIRTLKRRRLNLPRGSRAEGNCRNAETAAG